MFRVVTPSIGQDTSTFPDSNVQRTLITDFLLLCEDSPYLHDQDVPSEHLVGVFAGIAESEDSVQSILEWGSGLNSPKMELRPVHYAALSLALAKAPQSRHADAVAKVLKHADRGQVLCHHLVARGDQQGDNTVHYSVKELLHLLAADLDLFDKCWLKCTTSDRIAFRNALYCHPISGRAVLSALLGANYSLDRILFAIGLEFNESRLATFISQLPYSKEWDLMTELLRSYPRAIAKYKQVSLGYIGYANMLVREGISTSTLFEHWGLWEEGSMGDFWAASNSGANSKYGFCGIRALLASPEVSEEDKLKTLRLASEGALVQNIEEKTLKNRGRFKDIDSQFLKLWFSKLPVLSKLSFCQALHRSGMQELCLELLCSLGSTLESDLTAHETLGERGILTALQLNLSHRSLLTSRACKLFAENFRPMLSSTLRDLPKTCINAITSKVEESACVALIRRVDPKYFEFNEFHSFFKQPSFFVSESAKVYREARGFNPFTGLSCMLENNYSAESVELFVNRFLTSMTEGAAYRASSDYSNCLVHVVNKPYSVAQAKKIMTLFLEIQAMFVNHSHLGRSVLDVIVNAIETCDGDTREKLKSLFNFLLKKYPSEMIRLNDASARFKDQQLSLFVMAMQSKVSVKSLLSLIGVYRSRKRNTVSTYAAKKWHGAGFCVSQDSIWMSDRSGIHPLMIACEQYSVEDLRQIFRACGSDLLGSEMVSLGKMEERTLLNWAISTPRIGMEKVWLILEMVPEAYREKLFAPDAKGNNALHLLAKQIQRGQAPTGTEELPSLETRLAQLVRLYASWPESMSKDMYAKNHSKRSPAFYIRKGPITYQHAQHLLGKSPNFISLLAKKNFTHLGLETLVDATIVLEAIAECTGHPAIILGADLGFSLLRAALRIIGLMMGH